MCRALPLAICAAGLCVVGTHSAAAQSINISKAQRSKYPIAIPVAVGGDSATAKIVEQVATSDLSMAGWFKILNRRSFLANLEKEGMSIEADKWKDVGAFGVMKYSAQASGASVTLNFKLYEIEKGNGAVLKRTYKGSKSDVRNLVHMWCNDVVLHLTGEPGFFGSKITFTSKVRARRSRRRRRRRVGASSRIMVMDFDGNGAHSVTRNRYINILPSFSPGGGKIAFTSYMRNNPDLYVVSAGGGRPRRISKRQGMNTGASWSPDGSKIAVTLSKDGNPEIYIIGAQSGRIIKRLTRGRYIDTSPAWSPNGKEIAFVSDRHGSPQVFVMSAGGGGARRVSMNGNYNTTPTWSPEKGKRILAYTTRGGQGKFDIVTLNLDTKKMVRITQNAGNNEEPAFAPNGRAIAFARSGRGAGVYVANVDGTGDARKVYKGTATSVDWGPAPKQ